MIRIRARNTGPSALEHPFGAIFHLLIAAKIATPRGTMALVDWRFLGTVVFAELVLVWRNRAICDDLYRSKISLRKAD
jgi:hypothetical protein